MNLIRRVMVRTLEEKKKLGIVCLNYGIGWSLGVEKINNLQYLRVGVHDIGLI